MAALLFMPAFQAPSDLTCTINRGGGVADGPARTFENVADRAVAIVEAVVDSVTPPPPRPAVPTPGSAVPAADVVLTATRVLKGPETLKQFAVAQIAAVGTFNIRPGQRYIFFLNNADPRAAQIYPDRPGVPRFTAVTPATLCVDSKVHVSENGNFLRARFDGADLEKAVEDIRLYLKR
jgi:hypothetical protein